MPNNIAPIYDPTGLWKVWNINDIYTGPTGTGAYVPKVGDQINQIVGNVITSFIVESIAPGSMIATLTPAAPPANAGLLTNQDVLFGVGPGTPSDTYRVYIDKSVIPYSLAVDARLMVAGSLITTCKIFAGSDLGTTPNVISATYDSGGNYVGENVSLELVASSTYNTNTAIKVVSLCNTSADLANGDIVTAVFYDTNGYVVSKRQLLVENTGFIRSSDANSRAIIGIGIQSPFLSSTNSTVINYPLNLQMDPANMTGVVYYSDGSSASMAIDGVRFSISGLDSYLATAVGQSYPIVVRYVLQSGEIAYGTNNVNETHISKNFTLNTVAANLNYQVRLFAYPVWNNSGSTYTLKWFLYDAARSISIDVTSYVTLQSGSPAFNPTAYGVRQTLTGFLNLANVDVRYNSFVYSQSIDVNIEAPGTFRQNSSTPPNWFVTPVSGTVPLFGSGVFATFYNIGAGNTQVKLQGNYLTLSNWLAAYYRNASPLVLLPSETAAPTPTHFNMVYGGSSVEYPIASWNAVITVAQTLITNDTMYLEFFERTAGGDLQLAVAGVPIYAVNALGVYL